MMSKRACIARQQKAKEAVDATGRHVWRHLPMSFDNCIDCGQGRKIMTEEKSEERREKNEIREAPPLPSRTCSECGEEKPETEFYRSGHGYLERMCKKCKMRRAAENKRRKKPDPDADIPAVREANGNPRLNPVLPPSWGTMGEGDHPVGANNHSPLQRQVGGDHYKGFAIQPIEFSTRNGLGFIQGDIIKRICRYNRPGGKGHEDLRKIVHECELLMEMDG
jgi:hypothetical protein